MKTLELLDNEVFLKLPQRQIKLKDVQTKDLKEIMNKIYDSPDDFEFESDEVFSNMPNKVLGTVAIQLNQKLREFKEQAPTIRESIESEFKI